MADSSLDDFFAKKDKSKKKSKVKSVEGGDEITKSTKKEKKKDKNAKVNSNTSTNKSQERKPDDDEWNDFEEEKAVDYSGLRIQNLQQKEDVEKDGDGEEEEFDENGEIKEKKDSASGPWKKSNPTAASAPAVVEEEKPAPAAAPVVSGVYIPPTHRAGAATALFKPSGLPGARRRKELPNIRSDVDFPTLASGPGSESQQHIQEAPGQKRAMGVLLENKFSVLQD